MLLAFMQAIRPRSGQARRAVGVVQLLLMSRMSSVPGSMTQAMEVVTCLNFYSYVLPVHVVKHKLNTRDREAVSSIALFE